MLTKELGDTLAYHIKEKKSMPIREQKEEGAVSEKFTMADVLRLEPLCQAQRELGIQSRV